MPSESSSEPVLCLYCIGTRSGRFSQIATQHRGFILCEHSNSPRIYSVCAAMSTHVDASLDSFQSARPLRNTRARTQLALCYKQILCCYGV